MAISSTDCRTRVAAGRPVWYLVPDGVVQYISKRNLYRNELIGQVTVAGGGSTAATSSGTTVASVHPQSCYPPRPDYAGIGQGVCRPWVEEATIGGEGAAAGGAGRTLRGGENTGDRRWPVRHDEG